MNISIRPRYMVPAVTVLICMVGCSNELADYKQKQRKQIEILNLTEASKLSFYKKIEDDQAIWGWVEHEAAFEVEREKAKQNLLKLELSDAKWAYYASKLDQVRVEAPSVNDAPSLGVFFGIGTEKWHQDYQGKAKQEIESKKKVLSEVLVEAGRTKGSTPK